jgi:hypothetical protein
MRLHRLRPLIKAIGAFAIVAASFFVTLWAMDLMGAACPSGTTTALKGPFPKYSIPGVAWVAPAPEFESLSDSVGVPPQSNLLLCENDYLLGPMRSGHADIAKNGNGRYSHWKNAGFIFSTSDNSDPNTNGRGYRVVRPQ